jgi:hypothetical protein
VLLVFALSFAGFYVYNESEKAWANIKTWHNPELSSFWFENGNKSRSTVIVDEDRKEITYTYGYCGLYNVTLTDTTIDTYCSLVPFDAIKRYQIDTTKGLDGQIMGVDALSPIHFSMKRDSVKPGEYAGIDTSRSDLFTVPLNQGPVPVSAKYIYSFSRGEKNVLSQMRHYLTSLSGETSPLTVSLLSWEVKQIPTAEEFFAKTSPKEYFLTVARDLLSFVDAELKIENSGTDFNKVADVIKNSGFGTITCDLLTGCERSQKNKSEKLGFFHYLYLSNYASPTRFSALSSDARTNYQPFVSDLQKPIELINSRYDQVTFPLCPVAEVVKGDFTSPNVKFFLDYYSKILVDVDPSVRRELYNEKSLLTNNLLSNEIPFDNIDLSFTAISLDEICYSAIREKRELTEASVPGMIPTNFQKGYMDTLLRTRYGRLFSTIPTVTEYAQGKENMMRVPETDTEYLEFAKSVYTKMTLQPYAVPLLVETPFESPVYNRQLMDLVKTGKVIYDIPLSLVVGYTGVASK